MTKERKGKMTEPTIVIPVGDWADEYREDEPDLSTFEAAVQAQRALGAGPQKMARLLAIAKNRAEGFDGLPEAKPMLMTGYAAHWSTKIANQLATATLRSGKQIALNRFVGTVAPETDEEEGDAQIELDLDAPETTGPQADDILTPVEWNEPEAMDRAISYLLRIVPGYIFGRLKIIAANDGDVFSVVNDLHDKIDELARRLV